jgi:transaldolase
MIKQYGYGTKILAASFRNIAQVNKAFLAGAQTATVEPSLLLGALEMPDITKAVSDFSRDWGSLYGGRQIAEL